MQSEYCIFYVDDDRDDQEMLKEAIEKMKFENVTIYTQDSGLELMLFLRNPPPTPRLIFLDLNMPVKNGYEVLKEIRRSHPANKLPVIIFSTSNDETSISKSKELGANLYVTKPASFQELIKTMQYIFSIDWPGFTTTDKNFCYNNN